MSLKPVRRSRRRANRHPRFDTGGQWNFSWKPVRKFEPSKHRRALLLLLILTVGIFVAVWAQDPSNTLFHSYIANGSHNGGVDPFTYIYQEGFTSGNINGWIGNRISFVANDGCSGPGCKAIRLASDNNGPAIALANNTIDMSTASGKVLGIMTSFLEVTASSNTEFGWFLTRNQTVVGIGPDANYNPGKDANVALYYRMSWQPGAPNNVLLNAMIQHNPATPINNEEYGKDCAGGSFAGDCMIVTTQNANGGTGVTANDAGLYLNYTGATGVGGGNSLNYVILGTNCLLCGSVFGLSPFKNTGDYYLGFFVAKGTFTFDFTQNTQSNSRGTTINGVFTPYPCYPCLAVADVQPQAAATAPGPFIDTGGFFGPVIKALIGVGVFILNAILAFVGFIIPALQSALNFLITIMVATLNGMGQFFGLGNIGTDLQNLINSLITFFANGSFANIFTNLPIIFSRLIDLLTVYFPWLPKAITIGVNVATFAINGINFTLTVFADATLIGIGVVATLLIVLFFVYTGDNSLGGVLEFWETFIWLVVGLGLKFLSHLVNFVLDVVTALIGVIPKPFVQMVAHALPRIPIVEVDARFVQPSGLMTEIRNGNLFAMALWISGLLFVDLFESASPALPGSIGALIPAAAAPLVALKGLTSLLALMTVFVWIAAMFVVPIGWFSNAMDLGINLPFESSLGARPSSHLGIRVRKGEKHKVGESLRQFRSVFRRRPKPQESEPSENIN